MLEFLNDVFPIILFFLGAVLLVMLIILVTNLIDTAKKINIILDDVEEKSRSLDGLFNAIDSFGDTVSNVNLKMISFVGNVFGKLSSFKKKKKKKEKEIEEESYDYE